MTCTPSAASDGSARTTRRPWPSPRPDSTCETTAASDRTKTRVARVSQTHTQQTQTVRLAVIPGDGIGPEVTAEALKVLEQVAGGPAGGVKFESTRYDLGAERYLATGEVLPKTVLSEMRENDAILLGAVRGGP